MKLTSQNMEGEYNQTFNGWTKREMQLNRLHEEILVQREALLSFTISYTKTRENVSLHEIAERERCRIRNEQFLQNLEETQRKLAVEAAAQPSPRLTTLQNNYWYMVKSMKPMWEKHIQNNTRSKSRENSKSETMAAFPSKNPGSSNSNLKTSKSDSAKNPKKKSKWTTRFKLSN